MTTFADMQAAVIAQTKRPELVTLTDNAIRMATLRAHHVDFFSRDHTSQILTWALNASEPWHDFATIYNTVARLRTIDFMQAEDVVTQLPTENLGYVNNFKEFYDEWNMMKSSVLTLIGATLRVRFAIATGRARLFFYQNPDVATATYSSWIADAHMEELALWAAGIVWMRSGFQEIAKEVQGSVLGFKELLVTSYLSGKK